MQRLAEGLNSYELLAGILSWWQGYDTRIVLVGAIVAMSCALPGIWLVLRQQSMMGDALSHTALPGIILAFLVTQAAQRTGWLTATGREELEPLFLALGACVIGILTAVLTEAVQQLGKVESNAALGVVFTSLFAVGLLLVRLTADDIDLDPDCVLFGQIELVVWETVTIRGWEIPVAAISNGLLLLANLALMGLFFKELRLSAFDPEFANSMGIRAGWFHYLLMGQTAATLVMAFESVGSILVVALLIVPAASAILLSDRLRTILPLTLVLAAVSAIGGHVLARTFPGWLFGRLGFPQVQDAGTAGMIAVACGMIFVTAFLFSPQGGLLGRWRGRMALLLRMAADDVLATLYRFQEREGASRVALERVRHESRWIGPFSWRLALWSLRRQGLILAQEGLQLTDRGSERALQVVRSHRLWESYLQKHFDLPAERLHESAHLVEHYLDQDLQAQLNQELDSPQVDPHGAQIPDSPG